MLLTSIFIVLSIVVLEGLLSVDNSVVISMIANKAKPEDRPKVVKYGIIGALVFRGLALCAVGWLMANPEIGGLAKLLGAIYLVKMGWGIVFPGEEEEEGIPKWMESLFKYLGISGLFAVILEVEFADFVFSIDNLFAAVAFTENVQGEILGFPANMFLTVVGVSLGIITMRWIVVKIMKLIDKYPSLNTSAGIVIVLLGLKLMFSAILTLTEVESILKIDEVLMVVGQKLDVVRPIMENHKTDFIVSAVMMAIFVWPLVFKKSK